jgi:hypothetical protein
MVASGYENACSETSAAPNAGIHIISTQETNRTAPSPDDFSKQFFLYKRIYLLNDVCPRAMKLIEGFTS